jgi:hypothetical protein
MVQDPGRPRFVLEAAQTIRILRKGRRQDFDGDLATEPGILRPVDFSHAARAERREDLVGTKATAGRDRRFEIYQSPTGIRERITLRPCFR